MPSRCDLVVMFRGPCLRAKIHKLKTPKLTEYMVLRGEKGKEEKRGQADNAAAAGQMGTLSGEQSVSAAC